MAARRWLRTSSIAAPWALVLIACRALVGSYEVGPATPNDGALEGAAEADVSLADATDASPSDAPDVAPESTIDTTPPETRPFDAPPFEAPTQSSCRGYHDANPGALDGHYQLAIPGGPWDVWCDMKNGGYTLVALHSSTASGSSVWHDAVGVTKTHALFNPDADVDAILDLSPDWNELGFTEVVYELGDGRTRARFPTLTATQKSKARSSLGVPSPPTEHPDCLIDGTNYPQCFTIPGPPPGDPPQSFGWLYSPTHVECWWSYNSKPGTADCKTSATGKGRVWVK